MKKHIGAKMRQMNLMLLIIFCFGCQSQSDSDGNKNTIRTTVNGSIDNHETSKSLTNGDEVAKKFPLSHFYLGYKEWETISCIISISQDEYWNKSMIGLIEKTGLLRVEIENQTIRLKPKEAKKIGEGDWSNTYFNDTIEIKISALFKDEKILRSLTGNGKIEGKVGESSFSADAFLVFNK